MNLAAAAEETEPTADANDADDRVIVEAQVITQTSMKPFPTMGLVAGTMHSNGDCNLGAE